MNDWHNLPAHIKITYQSQAQYEQEAKGEAVRFTNAAGLPLNHQDFSDEQLEAMAKIFGSEHGGNE
jgi:hypothetical protein